VSIFVQKISKLYEPEKSFVDHKLYLTKRIEVLVVYEVTVYCVCFVVILSFLLCRQILKASHLLKLPVSDLQLKQQSLRKKRFIDELLLDRFISHALLLCWARFLVNFLYDKCNSSVFSHKSSGVSVFFYSSGLMNTI